MLGQSSNLRPNLGAQSPPTRPSEEPFPTAGSCHMYRPAPLRGRSPFDGKKVLLIDGRQATREVRENVLRSHGIEVDAAETLQSARVLWKPHRYDLVLLDVRRQFPGEAIQFYEQIRDASPRQRFAFLVGPPVYLSRRWPLELTFEDTPRGQWGETVKRFLAAAETSSWKSPFGEVLSAACGRSLYGSGSLHNSPGQADPAR